MLCTASPAIFWKSKSMIDFRSPCPAPYFIEWQIFSNTPWQFQKCFVLRLGFCNLYLDSTLSIWELVLVPKSNDYLAQSDPKWYQNAKIALKLDMKIVDFCSIGSANRNIWISRQFWTKGDLKAGKTTNLDFGAIFEMVNSK